MRILLDEKIPLDFASQLPGHDVSTVTGLEWNGVLNGELMKRAADRFDVFVTLDRNIEFQQNISTLRFAVIVLRARSNRMIHLTPMVPALLEAIDAAEPGKLQRV